MSKILTGKEFENDFKKNCEDEGIFVERIKDSAMSYDKTAKFTTKNPYDFHVYKMPFLYAFELKHTKYSSMSIQTNEDEDDSKMIKYHQIQALHRVSKFEGIKAGFILSFYLESKDKDITFFIDIKSFLQFLKEENKKSINLKDILKYNGKLIKQEKKRTHYKYEIAEFLDRI